MSGKINFIGPTFPPAGGARVKHSTLIKSLEERDIDVNVMDPTDLGILFFLELAKLSFKKNPKIILGASKKLRTILVPYLYLLVILNNANVVLNPVGGKIADELNSLPKILKKFYLKLLSSFDQIYVQTHELKHRLNFMLFTENKVSRLKNFKKRPQSVKKNTKNSKGLDLTYIGRMTEEKGILDSLKAAEMLWEEGYNLNLHFYGPFRKGILSNESTTKKEFMKLIKNKNYVHYHGILDPDKINNHLSKHQVFVFPTYFEGEGFPGVLLDAFFSGLPVITTDWNYNKEIIRNKINGLIIKPKNPEDLAEKIKYLYHNRKELKKLSHHSYKISKKYDVNTVIDELVKDLTKYGWFKN